LEGDGREGYEANGPYDIIHVGAAAAEVPEALKAQLAPKGVMVIPVGEEHETQSIKLLQKDSAGNLSEKELLSVMYIPLCDREKQWK